MRKAGLAAGLIAGLVLIFAVTPAADAFIFMDDFDDNSIDTFWWSVGTIADSTVQEVNNQLEMTQGSLGLASGYAHLIFNYPIIGDYSAQVDYSLLAWPVNNEERAAIAGNTAGEPGAVERVSDNDAPYGGEVYLTHFGNGIGGIVATTDTSGQLMVKRTGTTLEGYFWNGGGWTLINSDPSASTSDATIQLAIWSGSPIDVGNQVAFDNFLLNAPNTPNPIPEPASMLLVSLGLLGAGILRKRK